MSQPTKNADRKKEREVVIAAQSTLDAVKEAARELDQAAESGGFDDASIDRGNDEPATERIPLIMGALEKLASATDQMAQQLGDRLEEVRSELTRDLGEDRNVELREEVTALSSRVEEIGEQLARVVDLVNEKVDAATSRVDAAQDAWREQIRGLRGDVREDLDAVRDAVLEQVGERIDSVREEIERNRAETAKGHRSVVTDLAEGIGLAQTASEKRFDELETALNELRQGWQEEIARLREQSTEDFERSRSLAREDFAQWQTQSREHFDSWTREQAERLAKVERHGREIGELGQRLDRNHNEMMQLFEQEKQRAAQFEHDRQREQARRLNNAGVARYHSGEFQRARELFEQAVEFDQNFAEAFNNLGLCLTELGEHEEATVAFEAAIELNPDLGASYNNLGYVLYLQENFEAAIEMYKEAIGRQHDTSAAYTNLGNAYQKLRQTDKAVDAWRQALEVDPSNERAQQYLERFAGGVTM